MGVLRVNLKSLAYFVEVAKDLSITGAAQRLYLSQQALSLQIQKLERYYGVTLFERQPRFRLTSAGELLLEGAQKILRENDAIVNSLAEISESHAGTLRIGIPAYRAAECFPLRERGGLDQSLVYLVRHKSQKLPRHMAEFSQMMHDAWEKIAEY